MNVPTAVWIDEAGFVRRIDEGAYATTHNLDDFAFGRDDYAPMVASWAHQGEASPHLPPVGALAIEPRSDDEALAEPTFRLGAYFSRKGDAEKATRYFEAAQRLDPKSWNYARQDWSFTPETAGQRWLEKVQTLEGAPYYRPIEGLDEGND